MYTRENTIMEDLDEETAHKILEESMSFLICKWKHISKENI